MFKNITIVSVLISICFQSFSQHSVARKWNDALLDAIRTDYARPTVHARNLFHSSVIMYDAWAVFDAINQPFFLGDSLGSFYCEFDTNVTLVNTDANRAKAISYAVYRLLKHRFKNSPGSTTSLTIMDTLMVNHLGYDTSFHFTNYASGNPAALGNYLAEQMITFGLQDGSNEQNDYENQFYTPVNGDLVPASPGNYTMTDPNRWQPLALDTFVDQAGNVFANPAPEFLSPEWGQVVPFALERSERVINTRSGFDYWIYHDPGAPPHLDTTEGGFSDSYKWGFALVAIWSAHLDPADTTLWDISPASLGNGRWLPDSFSKYPELYKLVQGGGADKGYSVNPYTKQPYDPQLVPRGDYARVLAEFWADGPDSETPPGHWFTILNYVNDHPAFVKRFEGVGDTIGDLEWDVKAYLTLGGAVHDAAVTAWGIKGWYDYVRPISAIRYMAKLGQSSDSSLSNYHPGGMPLLDGYIEVVESGDPIISHPSDVGKIKLYAWRGPTYIGNPSTDSAGVGWVLAENWWPYQRPTFVTPPFAGYVSGHSTFSRAAAEVLTLLTGDEYFPGGMGEFHAPKNNFLVFEKGPSVDVTLQWATYRDASDQTSLSRIWGGIHPPADDIPGRIMGEKIGIKAFHKAASYFGWDSDQNQIDTVIIRDTITVTDTVYSDTISMVDTLVVRDTLYQNDTTFLGTDTIIIDSTTTVIHTIIINDTFLVRDTFTIVEKDTIIQIQDSIIRDTFWLSTLEQELKPYQLYPNPVIRDQPLIVQPDRRSADTRMQLYNDIGNLLETKKQVLFPLEIETSTLQPGVYHLVLQNDEGYTIQHFIVLGN